MLTLNPNYTLQVHVVGQEKIPVVILDDFTQDTKALRSHAYESLDFKPDEQLYYPGVRTRIPREYMNTIIREIARIVFKVYQIPQHLKPTTWTSLYSLVSLPPEQLNVQQRIPHFDSNYHFNFAMVHYLNEQVHGGTGIYRHLPTGYEFISQERVKSYFKSLNTHFAESGEPDQQYINKTTGQYELIHTIEYVPNRLALYPGPLLHSGLIEPDRDIDANPKTGRLTANSFFEFR